MTPTPAAPPVSETYRPGAVTRRPAGAETTPPLRNTPPLRTTPYLALDIPRAVLRFRRLAAVLPGTAVHYAVKANPHPELLAALADAGACFDVASPAEVRACLAAGAGVDDLVFSNPVKRRDDLAEAARLGVRLFAVDSLPETLKVAETAPGTSVLCRIATSGEGSDYPLTRKFGCTEAEAEGILKAAAEHGLDPAGISFHVGSQQRDPRAWDAPIAAAARVFDRLRAAGLRPWLLDLGGGFPAALEGDAPPLPAYGAAIECALRAHFPHGRPRTLIEPGRGLVADAGELIATVIGVVHRGVERWVYLDAGVFTGLVETLDEAVRYRLTSSASGPLAPAVLAGPTCDSADILYQRVLLPADLAEGDQVRFGAAGAYTTCYSTVAFNGFAPLATEVVSR